ncbi:MAG: Maf family protein [bacterium]
MTTTRKIILASESPRRKELLARIGVSFDVVPAGIDEKPWPNEAPASYALRNASDKARAVVRRVDGGCMVIAADTIVVADGKILEKPGDAAHATEMLRMLSGRWHEVITGVCVLEDGRESGRVVRTGVKFRVLSDVDIDAYVATGEPMDKAGSYAIQGGASGFVEQIEGSHSNVVGLPVEVLPGLLHPKSDLSAMARSATAENRNPK